MKWLVINQHRGQALWALALLAAISALIAGVGLHASHGLAPYNHWLAELQAAGCPLPGHKHTGPSSATCNTLSQQLQNFQSNVFAPRYNFAVPVFEYGVPLALILMSTLVGAPLVAREIEQRTQLVAWTQSVSRRKWYAVKVITLGVGLAAISLIAGYANGWLQHPLTEGGLTSSRWPWFFSVDLAMTGEVLLAYALAVALGAWLRRTVPAIGGALASSLVLPHRDRADGPHTDASQPHSRPALHRAPRRLDHRVPERTQRPLSPSQPGLAPPAHLSRHRPDARRRPAGIRLVRHRYPRHLAPAGAWGAGAGAGHCAALSTGRGSRRAGVVQASSTG